MIRQKTMDRHFELKSRCSLVIKLEGQEAGQRERWMDRGTNRQQDRKTDRQTR